MSSLNVCRVYKMPWAPGHCTCENCVKKEEWKNARVSRLLIVAGDAERRNNATSPLTNVYPPPPPLP